MKAVVDKRIASRRQGNKRQGFVLLMALVLILLASISLVSFARSSLQLANKAAEENENLQRKWGVYSCQTVLLKRPEHFFDGSYSTVAYSSEPWPLPKIVVDVIELGGLQFELQLADECAKVNLNSIFRRRKQELNAIVSSVTQSEPGLRANIRLPRTDSLNSEVAPLRSWGQIIEASERLRPSQVSDAVQNISLELTCWGSGKLNIRRASDASVLAICGEELSAEAVKRLLLLRREPGEKSLSLLISRMALRSKEKTAVAKLLTDESNCYSLWIVCRNKQRSWTKLFITHPGDGSGVEKVAFTW